MKTNHLKHLLPLAALALFTAACDPFTAKPGGDPRIDRVTVSAGSALHAPTVDNSGAPGTITVDSAWPADRIYIQFNKPMDGTSIQKYPNYKADGTFFVPPIDPDTVGIKTDPGSNIPTPPRAPSPPDLGRPYNICIPLSTITLTGFTDVPGIPLQLNATTGLKVAGTGVDPIKTTICYSAGSTSGGGMMVVKPARRLAYGSSYNISGTVKDYEGKSLAINVTISVDKRPIAEGLDGYSTEIRWWNSPTAVSYDVKRSLTAAGPFTLVQNVLANDTAYCKAQPSVTSTSTTGGACFFDDVELLNDTTYYYQVVEVGGAGAGDRPAATAGATTTGPLEIFPGPVTAGSPPAAVLGTIALTWYSIVGATDYDIEQAPDVAGKPGTPGAVTHPTVDELAAADPVIHTVTGLTSGTKYWFRATPTYGDAFVAEKGAWASFTAP
jgi:hypothetical protein